MKASIVTVCFNSENSILDTIKSVNEQTYSNIEHIFVDGYSSDKTCKIIMENAKREYKLISEPDAGIYDAMNKGFRISTGEVVAFLNSDDIYDNENIIELIMQKFEQQADVVYGNIYFVDDNDTVKRKWITGNIPGSWKLGFQIPHPAFFMKSKLSRNRESLFDSRYKIAADLKLQLSLFNSTDLNYVYLDKQLVKMRLGGASTKNLKSILDGFFETRSAFNDVYGNGGLLFATRKIVSKMKQAIFIHTPMHTEEN